MNLQQNVINKPLYIHSSNKKEHKRYQSKKKSIILSYESESDENDSESEEDPTEDHKKVTKEKISAYLSYLKSVISMYYSYMDSELDPDETMKNVTKPLAKYVEISKQFYKVTTFYKQNSHY